MAPPRHDDDFVMTLSDGDESARESEDESSEAELSNSKKRKLVTGDANKRKKVKKAKSNNDSFFADEPVENSNSEAHEVPKKDASMNPDFEFEDADKMAVMDFEGWDVGNIGAAKKVGVDLDEIIRKRKEKKLNGKTRKEESSDEDEDEEEALASSAEELDDEEMEDEEDELDESDMDEGEEAENGAWNGIQSGHQEEAEGSDDDAAGDAMEDDQAPGDESEDSEEEVSKAELARRKEFFAEETPASKKSVAHSSFQTMNLSRPIVRGLGAVGFSAPTPIQSKTIPVALLGKDVVGGAVTGSGKTAAFIVPILERLLYRPKKVPTSRVVILSPTRELAIQCHAVATKLSAFTDIKLCLAVGGLSLKMQEAELRLRPDIIIATPGRFIDHLRNSQSFTIDTIEILVLDEADRMLEDGFANELNEIIANLPRSRQTMLFSATMTESVDKLIRVGLNKPVRLLVDAKRSTAGTLTQEFVRIRVGREDARLAYLLVLCSEVFTEKTIVFFRRKHEVHRALVLFRLNGLQAAELHGGLSQEQRLQSVEIFRAGKSSFLLCTDLASRGLDIRGIDVVINYEAPQSHDIYLHRVGRTARAGRSGTACTLAAESDRKVVKTAVRTAKAQGAKIVSRTVDAQKVETWNTKIHEQSEEVEAILEDEKEAKLLMQAERDLNRGKNILEHEKEILARPKRTWFESEKDKQDAKKKGQLELNGADGGKGALSARDKEKKRLSGKDKKKMQAKEERLATWKKGKVVREEAGGRGALSHGNKKGKSASKKKGQKRRV